MKTFIKKLTPKFALGWYHWCLAKFGAFIYRHPSRQLIVIGVTGTKGKSTTVNLIAKLLSGAGHKVGLVSTINFQVADEEWANTTKQTMPGRFRLQELLSQMVKAGCRYAIVETSSEGIAQHRQIGIDYDLAVFTNLTPEHIESHGSFEKYRQAKMRLFESLYRSERKVINGQPVKKVIIANHDDQSAEYFLACAADYKYTYGLALPGAILNSDQQVVAREVASTSTGITFYIDSLKFHLKLLGEFNAYNALAAVCVGFSQGLDINVMKRCLEKVSGLPGRMEEIQNTKGIRIFVDYAHEPASLEAVYKTLRSFNPGKIISVLGSQGGGRDKAKRPILGQLAANYTDLVIVTNEDPYDEDPEKIIDDVINGATAAQSRPPVEKIIDRREAIKTALALAEKGDILIITGKGSETVMAVADDKKILWDDRKVVRELLK